MNDQNELPDGRILVIGLGNELLTDDGVGVHAARMLKRVLDPARVMVVEVGTAVLNALHLIESAGKILAIDAMQGGGPPGSVYTLSPEYVEDREKPLSLHQLSLAGALRFLPEDHRVKDIRIIGVEPQAIEYGMDLTPAVQSALARVEQEARRIIEAWS